MREQDAELALRAARLERLEQQLSRFDARSPSATRSCSDGRREAQGLQASIARLQAKLAASASACVRSRPRSPTSTTKRRAQRTPSSGGCAAERVRTYQRPRDGARQRRCRQRA